MKPSPLERIIQEEIASSGPITFRRYMELALYHPEHGYYTSGRAQVGRGGDFFTNVSVGSLFGRLLARQFIEVWKNLGEPEDFSIVEQGAHEGQFAADVLGEIERAAPDCLAATTYRIIEPSPKLAAEQRKRLAGCPVDWRASINELQPFVGVHFSNELIDAFPVHVVEWTGAEWRERHVAAQGGEFVFTAGELSSPAARAACAVIPRPLPAGYVTEVNPGAVQWLRETAAALEQGYILAIDYGHLREEYYDPARSSGTLAAYAKHRRENNPLRRPGEIDLTAHVNFSALIEAADEAGLKSIGYTDQHHFMVALGMRYFESGSTPSDLRAFQTLMHPTLMGQAFKVAAFAKNAPRQLEGFRYARAT